jgi:protein SCO1/2
VRRTFAIAVGAAATAGIAIGAVLHGRLDTSATAARPQAPRLPVLHGQATWGRGARPAPVFALHDQHGQVTSLGALRGRPVVLMFEDSLCRQACPIEGRMVAAAVRAVRPAMRPRVVVVSVDPWGDTRSSVTAAMRKWDLPGDTSWLLGTKAQLAPVWRKYQIFVQRVKGDIVHSTALYVIDSRGDERAGFLMPFVPALVADDFRALAREGLAAQHGVE